MSRPVGDYFHLRHKDALIASKCRKTHLAGGRWVKTHVDWVKAVLDSIRFAPTLPIFSASWNGMTMRLLSENEPDVVHWLRSHERQSPSRFDSTLTFVGFWCGLGGIAPGTASGNEAAEAFHSTWQAQLSRMSAKSSVPDVLASVHSMMTEWGRSLHWDGEHPLLAVPVDDDPSLLNGAAVQRAGRLTARDLSLLAATDYVIQHVDDTRAYVALPAHAQATPVHGETARTGIAAMEAATSDDTRHLSTHLTTAGVLQEVDGQLHLRLSGFLKTFANIAYVIVRHRPLLCFFHDRQRHHDDHGMARRPWATIHCVTCLLPNF